MNGTTGLIALRDAAATFAGAFETRKRESGEDYICLRDGSPEWCSEIVYSAHGAGDMLPDDVRYGMIREVADSMAEILAVDPEADLDDERHERVDSLVPVYNVERTRWLASHLSRAGYVDEAREEGLIAADAPLFELLGAGMFQEYSEVWRAIADGLQEQADEADEPQECGECGGTGTCQSHSGDGEGEEDCPVCNGSGVIGGL